MVENIFDEEELSAIHAVFAESATELRSEAFNDADTMHAFGLVIAIRDKALLTLLAMKAKREGHPCTCDDDSGILCKRHQYSSDISDE